MMRHVIQKVRRESRRLLRPSRTVDFIICGTQKGGTSALDAYLRDHPEVCMADKKEVHFFDNEVHFQDRTPDYSHYHAWFNPRRSHILLGEATPIYMYWEAAPARIRQYNPAIKLVVLLRNPIERAYSHWNMERSRGNETLSFWEAIQHEDARCRESQPLQHRIYSYIDRGRYLPQLRRLWAEFPENQVLVLKSEALRRHPGATLAEIYAFLGLTPLQDVSSRDVHSRSYEAPMSEREREHLISIFEPEIRSLELELNWDCTDWLDT